MGYRSEVKSIIYGSSEEMTKFMEDNITRMTLLREEYGDVQLSEQVDYTGNVAVLYLKADHIKWYEEYDYVTMWTALLTRANTFGLATEFARVGEDADDVELRQSHKSKNYLYTRTSIKAGFLGE